jgi:hypothetical protein
MLFDTQIAGAFVGMGQYLSLFEMLKNVCYLRRLSNQVYDQLPAVTQSLAITMQLFRAQLLNSA